MVLTTWSNFDVSIRLLELSRCGARAARVRTCRARLVAYYGVMLAGLYLTGCIDRVVLPGLC